MRWDGTDATTEGTSEEEDREISRKRDLHSIRHRAVVLRGGVIGGS
jgi:hypothetical protein